MVRRHLASPVLPFPEPAPPLENDDLLYEILLLLPPQPSSLIRASVVCKRWRRLVSDPGFLRRFRAHHRKPPLLGLLSSDGADIYPFIPRLNRPDRIPAARFSLPQRCRREILQLVECRHGLALFLNQRRPEAIVWNPISGHHRRVAFPPQFGDAAEKDILSVAVLCAAGDDDNGHVHGDCNLNSFRLALVPRCKHSCIPSLACLYESKSGEWGNVISTTPTNRTLVWRKPSVLVGNALCWFIRGKLEGGILGFDFEMQKLVVIDKPGDPRLAHCSSSCLQIIRTEEGNLGLLIYTGFGLRLWEHKVSYDDVATWVLQKTIDLLERLLPVQLQWSCILGYDEDHNVIYLWAPNADDSFTIQLDSIQFGDCFRTNFDATLSQKREIVYTTSVPYRSFYTADWAIGGRDDGPEISGSTWPDCPIR
ncbi:uncharacterized protein LOC123398856 [Hordeum vulgare subsp. vulgare]|uniref:F-box domain-containing protein n=1 Tax=Hordeum vulgare subsp. vulgare TaxID=112509 RepID=A0A8I7BEX3_HORVV|nr:uncharacterized protein LOC123398856 [Hordeum vulgare subsp. vulgare]